MVRTATLVVVASAVIVTGAQAVYAQSKAPACGIRYLPLFTGAEWSYESTVQQPDAPEAKLVVKVTNVKNTATGATITVEESFRDSTTSSELTCTVADGLVVPPQSFFFSGEPGGAILMTLSKVDHKGPSYPSAKEGLKRGTQWFEEVKADVTRAAAEGTKAMHEPASIEIERLLEVESVERVDTGIGPYRATRIKFDMRGRAKIGEDRSEMPAKEPGLLYFVDNIGLVRVRDFTGREWQLVDTNVLRR